MAVRHDLTSVFGLSNYKDFWKSELGHLNEFRRLPEAVKDWKSVTDAFDARNRLAHGRGRYTRKMAAPHVENLLNAVAELRDYTLKRGCDVAKRLPIRRRARS
jgi:hypothetical protein